MRRHLLVLCLLLLTVPAWAATPPEELLLGEWQAAMDHNMGTITVRFYPDGRITSHMAYAMPQPNLPTERSATYTTEYRGDQFVVLVDDDGQTDSVAITFADDGDAMTAVDLNGLAPTMIFARTGTGDSLAPVASDDADAMPMP